MSDRSESAGPLSGRVGESSLKLWVIVKMDRWLLTAVILGTTFLVVVALSQLGLTPLRTVTEEQNALENVFAAFIGAIITGTTIVVTINQLVLSQELGAVGDQRERMHESREFRGAVEEIVGDGVLSPEPSNFLHELLAGVRRQSQQLQESVADYADEAVASEIRSYSTELTQNAQSVGNRLETAEFGTFAVIWTILDFNYSLKIYRARHLRAEYGDSISQETDATLEQLIETLTIFGPAREHFKTLYFQWALINLSRALLYIAVPALVVTAAIIFYVDAGTLPGQTLGIDNLVWIASAGFTVGIAPFVIFMVFILRIATVAKHTLAMGPFILRETDRDESD